MKKDIIPSKNIRELSTCAGGYSYDRSERMKNALYLPRMHLENEMKQRRNASKKSAQRNTMEERRRFGANELAIKFQTRSSQV